MPSGPIPSFVTILTEGGTVPENVVIVDMGCGKGRNSMYLAELRFNVVGFDFVHSAVDEAQRRSVNKGASVDFGVVDFTTGLPIADERVDAVIDCNTTICIPSPGRDFVISEGRRVLKKGGLYLFYGVGKTGFVDKSPGPEPNSAIFPRTGKFEKQYTKEELLAAYKDFEIHSLIKSSGSDVIEGKLIEYSMWVGIFKKPV